MIWEKKGRVYLPRRNFSWNKSHAAVPTLDPLDEDTWRIYYSTRDEKNQSCISFLDVEAGNPTNILYEHNRPVLTAGSLGAFDDCGVMPSWVVTFEGCKYLYYTGWTVKKTVPYHNSIGLAISKDNGRTFQRYASGPLFGSTFQEPYFTGTSCVIIENGIWKNWYMSCTKWEVIDNRPEPFYHIKYAESRDGINWQRSGKVAIDFENNEEAGIVRASVLKEEALYKMWYAYRKGKGYRDVSANAYRIGYAESVDGIDWERKDAEAGIDVSANGWDSEMICYPYVILHNKIKYLIYNGNTFGRTGFGYAVEKNILPDSSFLKSR